MKKITKQAALIMAVAHGEAAVAVGVFPDLEEALVAVEPVGVGND
jgi:hypothetical protein